MNNDTKNISRNNYEVWVIDYLDGNLDKEKEKLFFHFMDKNPDLKKEFDMMYPIALHPEKVSFNKKYLLFKSTDPMFDMPESDYLMIKEMEDGLTAEEQKRLSELKKSYPALNADAETYKSVKLQPEKVIYLHKDSLQKTNRMWRILISVGSVAAAALLFFMLIPWNDTLRTDEPIMLSSNSEPVIENTTVVPQINDVVDEEQETAETVSAPYIAQSVKKVEIQEATNDETFIRQEAIASISILHEASLPQHGKINVYEMGLTTMIPQYIDNMRLLEAYNVTYEEEEENPESNSIFGKRLNFLTRIIPSSRRITDDDERNFAYTSSILEYIRR